MANCIKCGAALPLNAKACEYCGSIIYTPKEHLTTVTEPERASEAVQGTASVSAPRFKRVSIGLMLFFAIITLGLYLSIWFFVRREQFIELMPKKNTRYLFGCLLGLHIFYVLGYLSYLVTPDADLLSSVELFGYMFIVMMIYMAYITRAALAEFAASRGSKFADSIVLAILLNALYLQSQINRMLDARLLGEAS